MMHTPDLDRPIGEIFTDDSFMAFAYDFYASLPGKDDIPQVEDIYRGILSDEDMYREFMLFCKRNDFCFLAGDEKASSKLATQLSVFQWLRNIVSEDIDALLHHPEEYVRSSLQKVNLQEYGGGTMWEALLASIEAGIPVNSYGEVIYMIGKRENGYTVYSYESGVHEVSLGGKVIYDRRLHIEAEKMQENMKQNREQRQEVLKIIQKFRRFLVLIDESIIEDEHDIRLAAVMMQRFEKETGSCWKNIEGDGKEENVYAMRLKSYVFFKICDLEKQFQILQKQDIFSQSSIALVGGTDMGD